MAVSFGVSLSLSLKIPREYLKLLAQLVETLLYTPEGREFDSRWCHRTFPLT
jgi:hypothetical protein